MDCATEENEVRQALAGVAGIRELRIQLASRTLAIRADSAALLEAEMILRRLGDPSLLLDPGQPLPPVASAVPWFRLIAALVLAASVEAIPLLLSASWFRHGDGPLRAG
jgi:Cd2+/Zn2+-exporting ATPase